MPNCGAARGLYGSDSRRRGIYRIAGLSSTFHVCLLCVILISSQIYSIEGALGRFRKHHDVIPLGYRGWVGTEVTNVVHKREAQPSGWDLSDNLGTVDTGEDYDDINDAVMSSQKTSLTRKEIQKYLAQIKAYYLKNGMPR